MFDFFDELYLCIFVVEVGDSVFVGIMWVMFVRSGLKNLICRNEIV